MLQRHSLSGYLGDPTRQRSFLKLFESIRQLFTTSHVIGELKSRHKVPKEIQQDFWTSAMDFLAGKGLSEELVALLELKMHPRSRMIVCAAGPTDAGLMELAARRKCALLTDDRRLFAWMRLYPGLDVQLVENVLL